MFRFAFLAALLAGCAPSSAEVGRAELPVVGGTLGGDPAVLWIYDTATGGLCSAALITPRVVLTAKHCVQRPGATGPSRASSFFVGSGNYAGRGPTYAVQSVHTTPGIWTETGGLSGALVGQDVAVMVLRSPVTGIEPIPVRRASTFGLTGQTITACGFGEIPAGTAGTKYTAMGQVLGVMGNVIYVSSLICQGDSGGPMITAEHEVAGTVSFGEGGCGTGYNGYNAIYPFLGMIDDAIREGGQCVPNGAEVCDGMDNNCDGTVDEGCIAIGQPCTDDSVCVGNTCRDTAAGRICTTVCDPTRPSIGCGDGFYCAVHDGGICEAFCVPTTAPEGTLLEGANCAADTDCRSLLCVDPGDGRRRCLTPCRAGDGDCYAGEVCLAGAGACGGCVDASLVGGLLHGLGEPCAAPADCASGNCLTDGTVHYCSVECGSGCPTGFHCRAGSCARGALGGLGDVCVSSEDCNGSTTCATQGSRSWCATVGCSDAMPCPPGFGCADAGGVTVCSPTAGLLGERCSGNADCISGVCATNGTCTRICDPHTACGPGFDCERTSDGVAAVCARPSTGGGCTASPYGRTSGARSALVGLLALTVLLRRRRRARP